MTEHIDFFLKQASLEMNWKDKEGWFWICDRRGVKYLHKDLSVRQGCHKTDGWYQTTNEANQTLDSYESQFNKSGESTS